MCGSRHLFRLIAYTYEIFNLNFGMSFLFLSAVVAIFVDTIMDIRYIAARDIVLFLVFVLVCCPFFSSLCSQICIVCKIKENYEFRHYFVWLSMSMESLLHISARRYDYECKGNCIIDFMRESWR